MGKYLIITEHLISIWNICHDILNSQFNEIFFEKLKKNVFFFPFFFVSLLVQQKRHVLSNLFGMRDRGKIETRIPSLFLDYTYYCTR